MKKLQRLATLVALSTSSILSAQQFENGNLENWENVGTATEEPENWSSLKTADALASTAPQVLTRDAGRLGGYSARLEVKTVFGIPANGIMTNGRVHADFNPENGYVYTIPTDPQWHTVFTNRPDSLVGWFKYAPQSGDKGKVEVILHVNEARLPFNGYENNLIGRARYDITQSSNDWVRFSVPFQYFTTSNPEFILATVAAGDSTIAKNGTILWVDDLELIYTDPTVSLLQNPFNKIHVFHANEALNFEVNFEGDYEVVNLLGQRVQSGSIEKNIPFHHPPGIYTVRLREINNDIVRSKKLYILQ
jgi:hypothetical protein